MCTMAINSQFNGIELTFAGKPDETIREAMKAAGFRWHRQKKLWYAKNTAERLALAQKLSDADTVPAATPAPVASAEVVSKFGIKVGDILTDTWGYSMTIVEFYKVTKIVSASKIEIVELGHIVTDTDRGGGETVMPDIDRPVGEPVVKMVAQSSWEKADGKWHIKINDSVNLTPWDGCSKYQNTYD